MPNAVRAAWISELYPSAVVRIPDDPPLNEARDEAHRAYLKGWLQKEGIEVDAIFSSEGYGKPFAEVLGTHVGHRMVDSARTKLSVCGTMVRQDIHAHRSWLDPRV